MTPLLIIAFVLGLIVGSFSNVCIYRLPIDISIVRPRSFCPACKKPIAWYDNIPVVSFILLQGKCRFCKAKISFLYPAVELLTAFFYILLFLKFNLSAEFFIFAAATTGLIIVSFIDFKYQIIPDEVSLYGLAAGLILSAIYPRLHGLPAQQAGAHLNSFLSSFSGALAGGGILFIIGVLGKWIFKKDAMGEGDMKLLAMIGSLVGWKLVLLTIFLSSLFGSVVGLYMKFKTKVDRVPYGPFLSLGAFVSVLYGEAIINRIFGR